MLNHMIKFCLCDWKSNLGILVIQIYNVKLYFTIWIFCWSNGKIVTNEKRLYMLHRPIFYEKAAACGGALYFCGRGRCAWAMETQAGGVWDEWPGEGIARMMRASSERFALASSTEHAHFSRCWKTRMALNRRTFLGLGSLIACGTAMDPQSLFAAGSVNSPKRSRARM